jgi:hypothetical protein
MGSRGETNLMTDKKSFHPKVNGEAFKAMRRTVGAGVTATVVLSAALSVAFAIVLDGCSNNNKGKKTEVSSSNTNSPSTNQAFPTPSPIGYVSPVKVTHKKKTIVHLAIISYRDSLSGVSFRYPREYKLITADNSKPGGGMTELAPMNFALPGGSPVASIELPKGPATSFFEVNVNKSLTPDQCGEFADPDLSESHNMSPVSTDDGSIPVKVSLGGVEFTKVENGTQELDTRYYHRYDHGACYEFVMGVSEKPGNTIAVDHWELFDKMERILATVAIKSNVPTSVASVPATPNK